MDTKEIQLRKHMDDAIKHLLLAADVVDGSELIEDCITAIEQATEKLAGYIQRGELVSQQ